MRNKLFCLFAAVAANASVAAQNVLPTDSNVTIGKLSNGLTYILRHNEYPKDRADFYIVQKVGSVQEDDNQDGLAHFLEHMAFNGTKNFPDKKLIQYLESNGVRFGGNLNAQTSMDQTIYMISGVPTARTNVVDSALLILHDWSGHISLLDTEIDKERGVIREEWRQWLDANKRMYFAHMRNTHKGTPYEVRDVIGDTAVINNFTYNDLRSYYHKWYRPDLQGIIVVGDVDVEYVEKKIAELWKDIPAQQNPAERVYCQLAPNAEPIVSVVTDPEATYTAIEARFRFPAAPMEQRNSYEAYLENIKFDLLRRCLSSRLDELTNKASCPSNGAGFWISTETPLTQAFCVQTSSKLDSASQTIDFLLAETERIRRFGVTKGELELSKTNLLSQKENAFRSSAKLRNDQYISEYLSVFLYNEATPGIKWEYETLQKVLPTITVDDLNALINKTFGQNVVLLFSSTSAAAGIPTETELLERYNQSRTLVLDAPEDKDVNVPLVDHTPTPGTIVKATPNALFGAEEWVLSNGVRVYLKPTTYSDNSIGINAQSYGGRTKHDPALMPCFDLMMYVRDLSGIGNHSLEDLRRVLAGKSVSISPNVGEIFEQLYGHTTPKDFETALQLTYLMFQPMRYEPDAFAATMSGARTQLANALKDPNNAFADTVKTISFNGDPYYNPLKLENLDRVTHKDIMDLYNARFGNAADFFFYIVGDFEIDKVREPILTWLGGIATKPERETYEYKRPKYPKGLIRNSFEREMNMNKTTAYVAFTGDIEFSNRAAYCYSILGRILNIRYFETIREEESGTYGASAQSTLSLFSNQFILATGFDTDPALIDRLLPILEREVRIIADNGPKPDDLAKVKENMKKSLKEQRETNGYWIDALINKTMWDYDVHTGIEEMIESISPDEIRAAAKNCIEQGNRIEVLMNPAAKTE